MLIRVVDPEACEFEWDEYLEKTGSVPMPKELFTTAEPVGFLPGHQIEIIDKVSATFFQAFHGSSQ